MNEVYPQLRPEATEVVNKVFGQWKDTECGRFVKGLVRGSARFQDYFETRRGLFQKKLSRTQGDPEALEDLMHEIAVVAILLQRPEFQDIVYEPASKGPDIAATYESEQFFFEVTRIRDSEEKRGYKKLLEDLESRLEEFKSGYSVSLQLTAPPAVSDMGKLGEELYDRITSELNNPPDRRGSFKVTEPTYTLSFWDLPSKVTEGTAFSEGYRPFLFIRSKPAAKIADVVREKVRRGQFEAGPTILLVRTMAEDLDDYRLFEKAMQDLTEDHGGDPGDHQHRNEFFQRYRGLSAILFQHSWPVEGKQNFLAVNTRADRVLSESLQATLESLPLWPK